MKVYFNAYGQKVKNLFKDFDKLEAKVGFRNTKYNKDLSYADLANILATALKRGQRVKSWNILKTTLDNNQLKTMSLRQFEHILDGNMDAEEKLLRIANIGKVAVHRTMKSFKSPALEASTIARKKKNKDKITIHTGKLYRGVESWVDKRK